MSRCLSCGLLHAPDDTARCRNAQLLARLLMGRMLFVVPDDDNDNARAMLRRAEAG